MSVEYIDLQSLIFQNGEARQYYNELPKEVREQLNQRSYDINTYEQLQDNVKNIQNDSNV